jgi:hypothetical protein
VLDEGVPSDPDDRRLKGKLTRVREAAIVARVANMAAGLPKEH